MGVAAAAALVLGLGACSSSGASGTSSSGGSGGAASGPTGSTITIGAQDSNAGAAAFPQTGFGAQAAEWYINNKLGGINGHKLKVDLCHDSSTTDTAIACANKFVSEKVPVVYDTYDSLLGADVPILGAANIPIVGAYASASPADGAPAGKTFYFTGPTAVSALNSLTIIKKLGGSKAALAVQDATAAHTYVANTLNPIAKTLGIDISNVQYLDVSSPNYTVAAATEIQAHPDVAGVIALPDDGCTALFQALRQQGYTGTITAGSCNQFIKAMGPQAKGIVISPRTWVVGSEKYAPADVKKQISDFTDAMKAIGQESQISGRSIASFAGLVTLAQEMSKIQGDITPASVTTQVQSIKDVQMFLGPKITCDGQQWPGYPSACSHQAIYFTVQSDGTIKPPSGGFYDLDTSALPQK
jgi:branched-chain amino acid transport system substrate-binding protein